MGRPDHDPGDKLATIEGTNFTVDVYQVATATASKTGQFVDPDTNLPLIAEGDEIVYVNYVFTNTGSEDIPLSYSLVSVSAEYADWPYLQGMDSIVDSAQFEEMGVTSFAIARAAAKRPLRVGSRPDLLLRPELQVPGRVADHLRRDPDPGRRRRRPRPRRAPGSLRRRDDQLIAGTTARRGRTA